MASPLYSKAAQLAAALPQESGTVEQMLAMLRKRGAKPAELEHAGWPLDDNGKITKAELAEHFRRAMPKVQHRQYTDEGEDGEDMRQYEEYVAPGRASNYREHLLTVPGPFDREHARLVMRRSQIPSEMGQAIRENRLDDHESLRNESKRIDERLSEVRRMRDDDQFTSGHWDLPNIAAHFRTTDRPGPMLNVEEVQSDWGQKGRDTGFRNAEEWRDINSSRHAVNYQRSRSELNDARAARRQADDHARMTVDELMDQGLSAEEVNNHPDMVASMERLNKAENDEQDAQKAHAQIARQDNERMDRWSVLKDQAPEGPFVGTTGNWVDLALKHVLHEAVRGNYDHVSFNPGQANADMFGIDKVTKGISYSPQRKSLRYEKENGYWGEAAGDVEPEDLHRHIGKELAERLLSSPKLTSLPHNGQPAYQHILQGDDLRIGGQGMKSFYDQIVPKAALKLARQHDPDIQPNPQGFSPTGGFSIPITDTLRKSVLQSGFPAFADGGKVVDLGEKREEKKLQDFHGNLMGSVRERALEMAQGVRNLREAGKLPFDIGTRFHNDHTRRTGQPPYKVIGHYFTPKTGAYGYHVEQGDPDNDRGEDWSRSQLPVHDPRAIERMGQDRFDAAVASMTPLGGPLGVARAHGGRVLTVPGTDIKVHTQHHEQNGERILHVHKLIPGSKPDPKTDHWTRAAQSRIPPGDTNT